MDLLQDDYHAELILHFASPGALQALSMSSKFWRERAYSLARGSWSVLDMRDWPFAAKEVRRNKRLALRPQRRAARKAAAHAAMDAWLERMRTGGSLQLASSRHDDILSSCTNSDDGSQKGVACRPGGVSRTMMQFYLQAWPRKRKGTLFSDVDLRNALRHLLPGSLRSLKAFGSQMTCAGLAAVLGPHTASLETLYLSWGPSLPEVDEASRLGWDALEATLSECLSLQRLELHGQFINLPASSSLTDVRLRGCSWSAVVPALCECRQLRVLVLEGSGHDNAIGVEHVLAVLGACTELRTINLYTSGLDVSNEVLAAVIRCCRHLEAFFSVRKEFVSGIGRFVDFPFQGGDRPLPAQGLSEEAVEAFNNTFPSAAILIDDIARERIQDALYNL